MVDGQGDLEDQLADIKRSGAEVADRKDDLRVIEDIGAQMEEALILDNKYVTPCTAPRGKCAFLSCGHLDFGFAGTAQNCEFKPVSSLYFVLMVHISEFLNAYFSSTCVRCTHLLKS